MYESYNISKQKHLISDKIGKIQIIVEFSTNGFY